MKNTMKAVLALIVLTVFLVGCSQSGYLKIENETAGPILVEVNGDDEEIGAQDDETFEFEFGMTLINVITQAEEDVEVEYSGLLVFPGDDDVVVKPGEEETLEIEADGGGFSITNNRAASVTQVNITESTDPSWGDNLLVGSIGTGQTRNFGPFTAGAWDVRIISADDAFWLIFNSLNPSALGVQVNQIVSLDVDADDVVRWNEIPGPNAQVLQSFGAGDLK